MQWAPIALESNDLAVSFEILGNLLTDERKRTAQRFEHNIPARAVEIKQLLAQPWSSAAGLTGWDCTGVKVASVASPSSGCAAMGASAAIFSLLLFWWRVDGVERCYVDVCRRVSRCWRRFGSYNSACSSRPVVGALLCRASDCAPLSAMLQRFLPQAQRPG